MGGTGIGGAGTGGTVAGTTNGGSTTTGGTGGVTGGGGGTGGSTAGSATGGSTTGGGGMGGSATGGNPAGGFGNGGSTAGSATGGSTSGGGGNGGSATGGNPAGGFGNGGSTAGSATGGSATGGSTTGGNASGGTAGNNSGGGGAGGSAGGSAGSSTGGAPAMPDCNAQMPSGGQQRSGNGTGGEGNLAWEIWSNTGQGNLTTYSVPAFIASWNNSGGYLGRLGYEWGGFGDNPVPHNEVGTISAQFASRKTGSAGGYSYIGMYGWTNNPCVEWYVVDDTFGTLPFNPGGTTNMGERMIDGGTYVIYLRPTTGTGGSRCSGVNQWNQYYSIRKSARACGVISLSEHFNIWQDLGLDMTGELLEAKILVEVGGGVGNVELPVANVIVQ